MSSDSVASLFIDLRGHSRKVTLQSAAIVDAFVAFIQAESARKQVHYNVAIGGPGAVGKSHFARLLNGRIEGSTYLPLDAAVYDSASRDAKIVNGYQLAAYDLDQIRRWMRLLERRQQFVVAPFDHVDRRCVGQLTVDGRARVRIVEWVFALHSIITMDLDLRIALDADGASRARFLEERLAARRNRLSAQATRGNVRMRMESARREVDPTLCRCDLRLTIDSERNLTEIWSNRLELCMLLRHALF